MSGLDLSPPHPEDEDVLRLLGNHDKLSEGQLVDGTQRYGSRGSDAICDSLQRCLDGGWIHRATAGAVPPFGPRPMYGPTKAAIAWLKNPDDAAKWAELRGAK